MACDLDKIWIDYRNDGDWPASLRLSAVNAFRQWTYQLDKAGDQRVSILTQDDGPRPSGYTEVEMFRINVSGGSGAFNCGTKRLDVDLSLSGFLLQNTVAHEIGHALGLEHTGGRDDSPFFDPVDWPLMSTCGNSTVYQPYATSDDNAALANQHPASDTTNHPAITADPGFEQDAAGTTPDHWEQTVAGGAFKVEDDYPYQGNPNGPQGAQYLLWDPSNEDEFILTRVRYQNAINNMSASFRFGVRNNVSTPTDGAVKAQMLLRDVVRPSTGGCNDWPGSGNWNATATNGSWYGIVSGSWSVDTTWRWRKVTHTGIGPDTHEFQAYVWSTNEYVGTSNHAAMRFEHMRIRHNSCGVNC